MSGGAEIPSCAVDVAPDEMYGLLAEAGCLVGNWNGNAC